jgi:hypothetical protein
MPVTEWGMVQILPEGDLIQASNLWNVSVGDGRDKTFVRVSSDFSHALIQYLFLFAVWKACDKNQRFKNLPEDLEPKTIYGQLRHIFHIQVPKSTKLGLEDAINVVIAILAPCKILRSRKDLDIHYYKELGGLEFLDIQHVQCVVMRIVGPQNQWAIADRSGTLCCAQWD